MDNNQIQAEPQNSNPYAAPLENNPYAPSQATTQGENPYVQQPQYVYTESWMGATGSSGKLYTQPQQQYMQQPAQSQQTQQQPAQPQAQQQYTQPVQPQQAQQQYVQPQQQYTQQMYSPQPQPYYPQNAAPVYQNNPYAQPKQGNGMIGFSIAGMVCGILSICSCSLMIFDAVFFGTGLAFSIIALVKKYSGKGMATAGLICSSIGAFLSLGYFGYLLFVLANI